MNNPTKNRQLALALLALPSGEGLVAMVKQALYRLQEEMDKQPEEWRAHRLEILVNNVHNAVRHAKWCKGNGVLLTKAQYAEVELASEEANTSYRLMALWVNSNK
jgi:hypothetical protein